ncbi:hypothetical protein AJ78_03959 [Emergomyces pasteurianus Ep9510]|uniref:Uncharacterized protein n=1 Tax=Emergomyces pasteurianus Ep9510 TaxID=1447872 RepID=A0A1J9PHA9_9EURO|nr:hypothetical protein AJ78_03959 [Emergomyces pasteurianus Ep9510]
MPIGNIRRRSQQIAVSTAVARLRADDTAQERLLRGTYDSVEFYDSSSPAYRRRREAAKREFLMIIRALLISKGKIDPQISDEDLLRYSFQPCRAVPIITGYLAYITEDPAFRNRGRLEDKVKIGSIRVRGAFLWFYAQAILKEKAAEVYVDWADKVSKVTHKAAIEQGLSKASYHKSYYGVAELRLLFNALQQKAHHVDWHKQLYVLWALGSMSVLRPSSIGISKGYENYPDQFLMWKDLKFFPNFNNQGRLALQLTVRCIKHRRDVYKNDTLDTKPVTFFFMSVEKMKT